MLSLISINLYRLFHKIKIDRIISKIKIDSGFCYSKNNKKLPINLYEQSLKIVHKN